MKIFPTEIVIVGSKVFYRFTRDFEIHDTIIPKGFITDGATVPKIFWPAFPPVESYFGAAAVHDYHLSIGVDWKTAEQIFKKNLESDGIGKIKRFLVVNAVRVGGVLRRKRKII